YDAWFEDVRQPRGFAPPRIVLSPAHEAPILLTRQDWRGPKAGWGKDSNGAWLVEVEKETKFDVTLRFRAPGQKCALTYAYCGKTVEAELDADSTSLTLRGVVHPAVQAPLSATI